MTRAHLIAENAIRRHLPKPAGATAWKLDRWIDDEQTHQERFIRPQTDPLLRYVKQACGDCNRGWMGAIERDVAANVIALALGNPVDIDDAAAARLALWATVVSMLRATEDRGTLAVSRSDIEHVRRTSSLPDGYRVRLISGSTHWAFASRHMRFSYGDEHSHLTWFYVGAAAFVVSHPLVEQDRGFVFNLLGDAVQVLVPYERPIEWPGRREVPSWTLAAVTDRIAPREQLFDSAHLAPPVPFP